MKSLEQKIIVRCKNCGWRIFDKVTMTTGVIELKCPNCHRVVEVDLSLRKGTVKYDYGFYCKKKEPIFRRLYLQR
jgi:phage FluMu protein Com